jgi:hypothetical protein
MDEGDEAFQLMCTLKSQIIIEGNLSEDYNEVLGDLYSLMNENKNILKYLEKSNFIMETLLHTLKFTRSYDLGLQFISEMIRMGVTIPGYFYSKNFVFYITEKLYEQIDENETNLEFVTTLITRDRRFISSFEECGYFVLASSLIVNESCKLFRQIFEGYEEDKQSEDVNSNINQVHIDEDVMFEILRKNFDNEVVFREGGMIKFITRKPTFLKGSSLLDKIFFLLFDTNLYSFLEQFLEDTIPIISYKKVKCDWLLDNNQFFETVLKGDLSALRVLRHIIDGCEKNGLIKLESIEHLTKITKLLEDKSSAVKYETTMGICQFISRRKCENYSCFTEKRIRSIFSLLEKSCDKCACGFKFCRRESSSISESDTIEKSTTELKRDLSSVNIEFSDVNCSTKDFSSFTLFPSDLTQPHNEKLVNPKCLEKCETMKILDLLFNIYTNHKKVYFYKMSYIILLKSICDHLSFHNCFKKEVFDSFLTDFINFVISNGTNISRILFMFQAKKHKREAKNLEQPTQQEENKIEDTTIISLEDENY